MGKFEYDVTAALNNAPRLLGMELRPSGPNRLQGGYYLNGEPHAFRRDKLKVFAGRGAVWVAEEGGRCISLPQWLMEFGGAADYWDALRMIRGESQALHWNGEIRQRAAEKIKYVDPAVLRGAKAYDLAKCPLFRWMCGLFEEEKVRKAWEAYNVTTDGEGAAVFWYVDQQGRILHDKRMYYGEDGHRDKSRAPGRRYKVGDGYSGRCFFGACMPEQAGKTFVLESEKSALMAYLYYGRRFLATGGKGNLRDVEAGMMLLPDYDAKEEWSSLGDVWKWWESWPGGNVPEKADIGDLIEWKLTKRS